MPPVEIKELVIRTVVGGEDAAPGRDAPGRPAAAPGEAGTQELLQECVRQVLGILAKKKER